MPCVQFKVKGTLKECHVFNSKIRGHQKNAMCSIQSLCDTIGMPCVQFKVKGTLKECHVFNSKFM